MIRNHVKRSDTLLLSPAARVKIRCCGFAGVGVELVRTGCLFQKSEPATPDTYLVPLRFRPSCVSISSPIYLALNLSCVGHARSRASSSSSSEQITNPHQRRYMNAYRCLSWSNLGLRPLGTSLGALATLVRKSKQLSLACCDTLQNRVAAYWLARAGYVYYRVTHRMVLRNIRNDPGPSNSNSNL